MCFYTPCDNQTNECVNSSFLNYYTEMLMHLVFGVCIYLHKYWLIALRKNLKIKRRIISINDVNNLLSGGDDALSVAYKNISDLIYGKFVMPFDHVAQIYQILLLLKNTNVFDIGTNNFSILEAYVLANKIRQYNLCIACN